MRTQLLIITALSGLLLAGPLFAGSRYDTGGWKNSQRCPRGECISTDRQAVRQDRRQDRREMRQERREDRRDMRQDRREMRKSMKHRKMAMKFEGRAMRHREMARMHADGFGPQMGPDPMALGPRGEQFRGPDFRPGPRHEMRFREFGPNQAPDQPFGPRHEMRFRNQQFGPNQAPDGRVGPRQHMRLRDGTCPRAQ